MGSDKPRTVVFESQTVLKLLGATQVEEFPEFADAFKQLAEVRAKAAAAQCSPCTFRKMSNGVVETFRTQLIKHKDNAEFVARFRAALARVFEKPVGQLWVTHRIGGKVQRVAI